MVRVIRSVRLLIIRKSYNQMEKIWKSQSKKAEKQSIGNALIIYVSPVWGTLYDDVIKTLLFIPCEMT